MSITYRPYAGPSDLPAVMALVEHELSEPYVIYTYRYFLNGCPALTPVACIVCKQDAHGPAHALRGYIAMLSVHKDFRRRGIGAKLARLAIRRMRLSGADEVMLETEYDNASALRLYEALGFVREKRLFRFYLNGKDAFRLVLVPAVAEGEEGV
ncbi:acyl-CoA N-acyltransferase [Calocera cornea HHB12733]|uniref:Acyl-CoA N-acyltransferase n=1 Tax=Calocera cornea HHB12733 TaxID=1353952 RepID=A0A165G4R1_9BASI|nr:acyl-CoA N-acyltransferase [Calocera cornea HHB12733]